MANLQKSDGRMFASYPMPAKIDLLNERPRRESLVEQQLANNMPSQSKHDLAQPGTIVTEQTTTTITRQVNEGSNFNWQPEQTTTTRQQQQFTLNNNQLGPVGQRVSHDQQRAATQANHQQAQSLNGKPHTFMSTINKTNAAALLSAELAEKEANLMREITTLHQRPYSPFKTPAKIDLKTEQRVVQQQYQNAPSSRPTSQASIRSTSADLLEKEAKLMQEIEEMESKPYNPQTMVVERDQWFETADGRPGSRLRGTPTGLRQDYHLYEDNLRQTSTLGVSPTPGSIHTTIIRSPKREIDNKSPLPFAFDNFTTKGVRGNIASVGAVEPDRPRPPIYPIVKRTPSP